MIIYYALGGGLGHITRARKVLDALALDNRPVKIVTAIPNVPTRLHSPEQLLVVPKEWSKQPKRLQAQLQKWLNDYSVERVLIDTFPAGIKGELNFSDFDSRVRIDYVARYLNWAVYADRLDPNLNFHTSYCVEPLHPCQNQFIKDTSKNVIELPLPLVEAQQKTQREHLDSLLDNYWLIVHSGPAREVEELIFYANDIAKSERAQPNLLICTQSEIGILMQEIAQTLTFKNHEIINQYPAWPLFKEATKIISAAGFNTMQETNEHRAKQHVLPFERRYDDQFVRLANSTKSSSRSSA